MFVVAPITRLPVGEMQPGVPHDNWEHVYPVLWEDDSRGLTHAPIAHSGERKEAQDLCDELNEVLLKHVSQ